MTCGGRRAGKRRGGSIARNRRWAAASRCPHGDWSCLRSAIICSNAQAGTGAAALPPLLHHPAKPLTSTECSSWCPISSPTCVRSSRAACSRRNRAAAAGEAPGITPRAASARRPAAGQRAEQGAGSRGRAGDVAAAHGAIRRSGRQAALHYTTLRRAGKAARHPPTQPAAPQPTHP